MSPEPSRPLEVKARQEENDKQKAKKAVCSLLMAGGLEAVTKLPYAQVEAASWLNWVNWNNGNNWINY